MKFGKYLVEKSRPEWEGHYVDYKLLKDLIKESATDRDADGLPSFSPRTTSLTVQRASNRTDSSEEHFFKALDAEVDKIGRFTAGLVEGLRGRLSALAEAAAAHPVGADKEAALQEAKSIGDEFLKLEKYVNLNYMGFHKILKKHDKMLPETPCRQFYISHLHNQAWVQGNYSDLLVVLSSVYSQLRGDEDAARGGAPPHTAPGSRRISTKYWVRMSDVSTVKHNILQHLPVLQPGSGGLGAGNGGSAGAGGAGGGGGSSSTAPGGASTSAPRLGGDAELVNCVYLDNTSLELYHGKLDKRPHAMTLRLKWAGAAPPRAVTVERQVVDERWGGEETSESRFTLPERRVVDFLEGVYTVREALADGTLEQPAGAPATGAAGGGDAGAAAAAARKGKGKAGKAEAKDKTPEPEAGTPAAGESLAAGDAAAAPSPATATREADADVGAAAQAPASSPAACFAQSQKEVDAKQLRPMVRTQYMRSEFGIPFDPVVCMMLDTNIAMIKENTAEGAAYGGNGRWARDPGLPVTRTDITRFPHAVLDITLALNEGDAPPPWVSELVDSGLLTPVPSFSKFLHGIAALFPDMAQAVPYWVDDESVRASMQQSAPERRPGTLAPGARDLQLGPGGAPRKGRTFLGVDLSALTRGVLGGGGGEAGGGGAAAPPRPASRGEGPPAPRHPLLGDAPTLRLMPHGGLSLRRTPEEPKGWMDWWFEKAPMPTRKLPPGTLPQRAEPKTYFANERTFLSWLHMAVTLGSISSAMLGFSGAATRREKASDPHERDPMQLVAIILLPVAFLVCGYALLVYGWRSNQIASRALRYIDDRRGPLVLAGVVVSALSLVFAIGLADLIQYFEGEAPPPPGAPPFPPSPPF